MYAIGLASKSNVPTLGVLLVDDTILLISFLRDRKGKAPIGAFLESSAMATLYSFRGVYKERICGVGGQSNLSFISAVPAEGFEEGTEIVTYGNLRTLQQSILVKKKGESTDVFEELSSLMKHQSPIPMEYNQELSKIILDGSEKIRSIGVSAWPYSGGYSIQLSKFNEIIKNHVIDSYSVKQFSELFGRAPQIKSIRGMIDPAQFSVKTFPKILEKFGGKEGFEKLRQSIQDTIVFGYEIFGDNFIRVYDRINEFSSIDFQPLKNLAIEKCKGKFELPKNVYKVIASLDDANLFFNFFTELAKPEFRAMVDEKPLSVIKDNLKISNYTGVKTQGIPIAAAAGRLNLPQSQFEQYQEAYISAIDKIKTEPRTYPTIHGSLDNGYSWESMDMGNANGWFVGIETHCCQHLGGAAHTCVKFAANNPAVAGIFRVMKDRKTIAQSFFWHNTLNGDFVFDNIEVLGAEIRSSIMDCYLDFIAELEKRKALFGYKRVSVGMGCSDMTLENYANVTNPSFITNLPNGAGVYSDAGRQKLIREFR